MTPLQDKTFAQYPTFEAFIKDYEPKNLLVIYADKNTIEDSVTRVGLTLEDINTMYANNGTLPGAYYMVYWLQFLNKFSNITKPLTELQAVSVMLYNSYRYFHLADLKIIFEKIMKSEYGTFYGSVDAQRIITSFFQYSVERSYIKTKALEKRNAKFIEIKEKIEKEQRQIIWDNLKDKGLEGELLMEEWKLKCSDIIPVMVSNAASKLLLDGKQE